MKSPKPDHGGFEFKTNKKGMESVLWSSRKVEQLMIAIDEGYKPKSTPFYEGRPNLRKGNIVFEYTNDELREIQKCARDIVYFANNYCTVMTDDGLQTITLRPYQEEMLKQFQLERFNICLASRQVGKCLLYDTRIIIKDDSGDIRETTLGDLYYQSLERGRPLKPIEKIKKYLWKTYSWLNNFN